MKQYSFRQHQTFWYVVTLAALLGSFLVFIWSALAPAARTSVRDRVAEDTAAVSGSISADENGLAVTEVLISPDTLYTVYTTDGEARYANHEQQWFSGAHLDEGTIRIVTAGGREWILQDSAVIGADGSPVAYVRTGAPVEPGDTENTVFRVLLIVLPITGIAALFMGLRTTDGRRRRIDRIRLAAEEIRQGDFSRRLAVQDADDEIGQLELTFNSMLDTLEESMMREKQFTSDASHELRTPLAVVIGAAQTTLEHKDAAPEDYAAALRIIYKRSTDMQAMLSQMLLLARGDAQASMMEHARLNLSEMVQDITEEFSQQASERHITLREEVTPDIFISGDLMMMTRAVMNLLSNAVKFGREGGWIHVILRREGDSACLSVADNGEGIPPEALPHIFDRFYRADNSRSSSGFGLGLALTRRIAELHGGTIRAQSTDGAGSVFTLRLPLSPDGQSS